MEAHRQADGQYQLKDTGDDLIDKWEEQLARDEEPDLFESFSQEAIERLKKLHDREKAAPSGYTMGDTMREIQSLEERMAPKVPPKPGLFKTFGDGLDD